MSVGILWQHLKSWNMKKHENIILLHLIVSEYAFICSLTQTLKVVFREYSKSLTINQLISKLNAKSQEQDYGTFIYNSYTIYFHNPIIGLSYAVASCLLPYLMK